MENINHPMEFQEVEVNFIYSCIPSINNKIISFDDLAINLNTQKITHNNIEYCYFKFKPISRQGISEYLLLDVNMGYSILPKIENCILKYNDNRTSNSEELVVFNTNKNSNTDPNDNILISIQPILRIFSSGTSCNLKVVAKNATGQNIYPQDIHKILQCIGINKNCPPAYSLVCSDKPFSFSTKYFHVNNEKYEFTLYSLFASILTEVIEGSWSKIFNSHVKLLCRENLTHLKFDDFLSNYESQSPWVVTNIKSNKRFINEFHKNENINNPVDNKYFNQIAPILFRVPDLDMYQMNYEIQYNFHKRIKDGQMHGNNLYLDSRIYLQMSRRSILTIVEDFDIYPAKHLIPGLLDLSEMTRTRWQTLVILNLLLDNALEEYYRLETKTVLPINELIKLFNYLVKCLESPSMFVVSDDCLREIHEKLNSTFNITLLIKVALKKVEIYEKIHRTKMEVDWIHDSDNLFES